MNAFEQIARCARQSMPQTPWADLTAEQQAELQPTTPDSTVPTDASSVRPSDHGIAGARDACEAGP